jgi:hypothetical protein|tara:strand:+ start:2633 stop:2926 length:294 start_codon:yes stop_codon:yes gene_type:complete
MPPERGDYPYEVQVAFFIHDLLPDRWDGMSGNYMGKDYAALQVLLDTYEVEERKQVCLFIKHIEARSMQNINDKINKKQKASTPKAKGGGINSANLK